VDNVNTGRYFSPSSNRTRCIRSPSCGSWDSIPRHPEPSYIRYTQSQTSTAHQYHGFDHADLTFISRLGPFSSLETLECDTRCLHSEQCVFPLTDTDIERLASELPQLVNLWLGHKCKYSPHHTTIRFMISLSTRCLSLETLNLPCDLTNIPQDAGMGSGGLDPRLEIQSPCALRFFALHWVAMPPSEDVEAVGIVASALRHLFPRLGPIWE